MNTLDDAQKKKHPPPSAVADKGKKKGGRPKAKPEHLKKERVFMMNDGDYLRIKALAALGKKSPSEIVRRSIKDLKIIPAPNVQNKKAWSSLSRVTANLNQIAYRLNYISRGGKEEGTISDKELLKTIDDVKAEVVALRAEIGVWA